MRFVIGGNNSGEVYDALASLFEDTTDISIAVSYIQLSGWSLLKELLGTPSEKNLRILCTDQMGITDPAAVRAALECDVDIRNYQSDGRVYHPKLYLANKANGSVYFMSGSSNLSKSAWCKSVEINTIQRDDGTLSAWFEDAFAARSAKFDDEILAVMEANFRSRIHGQFSAGRKSKTSGQALNKALDTGELIDSLFGDVDHDIGLLNFDHTGNTVRNISQAQNLLIESDTWTGKNASELNHLGLTTAGEINDLGIKFRDSANIEEAANIWVTWLYETPTQELHSVNPFGRLVWAKRALTNFWKFEDEIIQYFLDNSVNPSREIKAELQTIELLSNSRSAGSNLSLADVQTLAKLLQEKDNPLLDLGKKIQQYLGNKGARSWKFSDRRFIISAWEKVSKSKSPANE